MKFKRDIFFAGMRNAFGTLDQSQVDGLDSLLNFYEADPYMTDVRWMSYCLATEKHEGANRWQPIEEIGRGKGRKYGALITATNAAGESRQVAYYGRGRVQLTWDYNYKKADKELRLQYPDAVAGFEDRTGQKMDLVFRPEQALDPELSYLIMSAGMRQGWFTGRSLSRYIGEGFCDYVNARKIINALDQAQKIADYARKFEKILEASLA